MAVVEVGTSSSQCSECKGNASPDDTHHIRGGPKSGWSAGSSLSDNNGCGVEFSARRLMYVTPTLGSEDTYNLTDMSKPFWKSEWPVADPLKHNQLAIVKVHGDQDGSLAIYRDWDSTGEFPLDPEFHPDPYWSFFGTDFTYRPDEVTVVKLVKVVDQ